MVVTEPDVAEQDLTPHTRGRGQARPYDQACATTRPRRVAPGAVDPCPFLTSRRNGLQSSEQIRMRAGADQDENVIDLVPDQETVRLDMTLPNAIPPARKLVRPVTPREAGASAECLDNRHSLSRSLPRRLARRISRSNCPVVPSRRINRARV